MERRQRGHPDREYVFNRAEKYILKGLRTAIGRLASPGFCSMRAELESTACEQGHSPDRWVEMRKGGSGKYRSRRYAYEGVDRVPDGIHDRDLVGQELHQVKEA